MGRLTLSIVILLGAWGAALAVPLLLRMRPLWPAAAATMLAVPVFAATALVALWTDVADLALGRVMAATATVIVYAFLAAPATSRLGRAGAAAGQGNGAVLETVTLAGLVLAGLVVTAWVGGADVDGRLLDGALRASFGLVLASLVLLVPPVPRKWPRLLGWLAFAQFVVVHALDPWVDGALSNRLVMAGVLLLFVLGLAALTLALLPAASRRPAPMVALPPRPPRDRVG